MTELDSERVEAALERIETEVEAGLVPAAQLAVARDGEIVLERSFGAADPDTRFAVFSCTKAFTGGIIWQLLGDGSLSLDDRAAEFVPEFASNGKDAVTVRHLLTHTGGFPHAPLGPPRWETVEGRLHAFGSWRLMTPPGEHFEYHPTAGHWVLGAIAEAILGQPLGTAIEDRLSRPLQLRFGLGVAPEEQGDVAPPTAVGTPPSAEEIRAVFGADGLDLGEVTPDNLTMWSDPAVRAIPIPGAGGVARASDLALYYQALLHNTGELWHPDVLRLATAEILVDLPDPMLGIPANRSAGLVLAGDDNRAMLRGFGADCSPGSFGHNGAGGQIAWADPASGLSLGFVTSAIDHNPIRQARRTISIGSKIAAAARP